VKVDLARAQAVVSPAAGKSFDPRRIGKAVRDAGFTPGRVEVTAVGRLAKHGELLVLEMTGAIKEFVLAGGAQAGALVERAEFVGQRLRVKGELHPEHADRAPGLTVEKFERLGDEGKPERPQVGKSFNLRGKLTEEGVECQAMRGEDGRLYTLVGELKGFRAGNAVCVRGRVAEISMCMQGTTLVVEEIGRTCR